MVEAKREYSSPVKGSSRPSSTPSPSTFRPRSPRTVTPSSSATVDRDRAAPGHLPDSARVWDRYARHHHLGEDARSALSLPLSQTLTNADGSIRQLRYYQVVAINRVLRAILAGEPRVLLLMATGSGKTLTALQLCWKLLSYWRAVDADRPRRVLYVADRDALIKSPLNGYFRPVFGEGATRIQGNAVMGREIYFATYQSLKNSHDDESTFEEYPPDFFDVIIVDECHRGSVPGSSWRAVLDRFTSAVHLGLTATPKRDDNVDTYDYFGEPVFEYSLRQGIEGRLPRPLHRATRRAHSRCRGLAAESRRGRHLRARHPRRASTRPVTSSASCRSCAERTRQLGTSLRCSRTALDAPSSSASTQSTPNRCAWRWCRTTAQP